MTKDPEPEIPLQTSTPHERENFDSGRHINAWVHIHDISLELIGLEPETLRAEAEPWPEVMAALQFTQRKDIIILPPQTTIDNIRKTAQLRLDHKGLSEAYQIWSFSTRRELPDYIRNRKPFPTAVAGCCNNNINIELR
ncbi:hypothetical protein AVEN_118603-1 [Araneus ventricosus]|uniref:Uncharacterized protein n=1 Tax=Araneus ventricosus TaxID=182803 RepID=A0A4Y2AWU6_ARAVE|nr:hypothetical protein AVEN_118603-1 [Araneus ventricosus]